MELNDYRQLTLREMTAMRGLIMTLMNIVDTLKSNEVHQQLLDDERYDLLLRGERELVRLLRTVNAMSDLEYYSVATELKRIDKVLVNQLCRDLAGEQDVNVSFETDIPDFLAISTHQECLRKVLTILLRHASQRVLDYYPGHPETRREVVLKVSEKTAKGKLTFSVTDTGRPTTIEEDVHTFNLPADDIVDIIPSYMRVEIFNSLLMVNLLGGFIYIDPKYRDGRRVVFNIAIK